jgi:hypothetical protein
MAGAPNLYHLARRLPLQVDAGVHVYSKPAPHITPRAPTAAAASHRALPARRDTRHPPPRRAVPLTRRNPRCTRAKHLPLEANDQLTPLD